MSSRAVLCLLGAIVAASAAWAQSLAPAVTVDAAMRGETMVADPGTAAAWMYNPAGLGRTVQQEPYELAPEEGRKSQSEAAATFELSGDTDLFSLNFGQNNTSREWGIGGGYTKFGDDTKVYGVGFGKYWPAKGVSWGAAWWHYDDPFGSDDLLDVGIIGEWGGGVGETEEQANPAKFGVVIRDLTDEVLRTFDIGAAWQLADSLGLFVDVVDLTDETDRTLRLGATKRLSPISPWVVGVGLEDGNLTLGALYDATQIEGPRKWRFGAAWMDSDEGDSTLLVGAFATWGF